MFEVLMICYGSVKDHVHFTYGVLIFVHNGVVYCTNQDYWICCVICIFQQMVRFLKYNFRVLKAFIKRNKAKVLCNLATNKELGEII